MNRHYGSDLLTFPAYMQAIGRWARSSEWLSPLGGGRVSWEMVPTGLLLPMEALFFCYLALLVGVLLWTVRCWRTADLVPTAILLLWLVSSLRHVRQASDMALLTAPVVAAVLPRPWPPLRRGLPVVGPVGLLALTALAGWRAWAFDTGVGGPQPGAGPAPSRPASRPPRALHQCPDQVTLPGPIKPRPFAC